LRARSKHVVGVPTHPNAAKLRSLKKAFKRGAKNV
jgi:hypothetical protein